MKRLHLTVEGQTEQAFAMDVLRPHLQRFDVFVTRPRLTGPHGRRSGRIPRGGMFNTFQHTLNDMKRWLKEDPSGDVRFSMMVDLYSRPHDFPGHVEAMKQTDPHKQAAKLEEALANELSDHRFIPYLQIHEFEALILTDPLKFSEWFDNADKKAQLLLAQVCTLEAVWVGFTRLKLDRAKDFGFLRPSL